jgi:hypothetical protein
MFLLYKAAKEPLSYVESFGGTEKKRFYNGKLKKFKIFIEFIKKL